MGNLYFDARTTADTAELYWDKPETAGADAAYDVFVDGVHAATTNKTHWTLTNLQPQQEYHAALRYHNTDMAAITFVTAKPRRRIDVTQAPYFAKGDGQTMNTAAIQQAFNDCGAWEEVYFPAGIYLTGALDLHSNMAVYLDAGAVLQGSEAPEDYLPRIRSRFEGVERECYRSLLNAGALDHTSGPNCSNILLYGKGTISGGGKALADRTIETERARLKDYLAQNAALVASCENDRTIPGRVRGRLINLSNCAHVRITGLTLQNGPAWNIHMIYCNDIVMDHCVIHSLGVWNGDGWDPDSSENCTLFATRFETHDDSVAIKSGKNPEGNVINRPTRHIRVFDCHSVCGHGICIGSEMSGGVEDVKIWDCDIAASYSGIEVKGTPQRGGYVRNISVRDCSFPRLMIHSVPYNCDGIPAEEEPQFEGFFFERMTLTGIRMGHGDPVPVDPIELEGFRTPGHKIKNVTLRDCTLPQDAHFRLALYEGLTLTNLHSADE